MHTAQLRAVRDAVYQVFAAEGRAPSVAELARVTGATVSQVTADLRELADVHALVLNADGDAIRMAHPFSAAPMAFVLTPINGRDERRWWGGCAWDSFGISAALALDVWIETVCPQCGSPIRFETGPNVAPPAPLAVRFPRPAAEWWNDVVATCTLIRMFCNRDHAELWTAENAPGSGYIASADTVWRLSAPWYGDRIAPDFQPHTREQNQKILDALGLTGAFWRLP